MHQLIQILVGGVFQGCMYALLAVGFSIVFRVTGVIGLAQGAFAIVGALVAHTLGMSYGVPIWAAAILSVIITTTLSAVIGTAAFVPGLSRLSHSNMLMLTAGHLTFLEGLILVLWGNQPYTLPAFSGERPLMIGGIAVQTQGLWIIGTTICVVFALRHLLQRSAFGRALRACAENATAASLVGVSVERMSLFSYCLAAAIAAIAGIVVAPATSLQFDTSTLFTIFGFIAVVIGGVGSFPGAIAGGLLLGIVSQLATAYVSSLFSSALSLGLLLIVLLWRPSGLLAAGQTRRPDVRDEPRAWNGVVRIEGRAAWLLSALAAGVALCLPALVPEGSVFSSLVIAGILFIAVMGLDLVMGYTGQVSLGQAGFVAIGGYTAGFLTTQYDVSPLLGLLAGMVLSLLCSLVLALVTVRLRGLYLALGTLSFGLLIDACAIGLDGITGGPSGLVGIPAFSVGSFSFDSPVAMYYLVAGIIAVLFIFLTGALRSDFGRALQAIRTDQLAAAALGINVFRYKLAVFAMSAVMASMAGSLYAFYFRFLSPEMVSTKLSLELVTMLVIGGEGTLFGPLFGAVLLTVLPTLFQSLAQFKLLATGGLMVFFFLCLPEGIYGSLVLWATRCQQRRAQTAAAVAADPVPAGGQGR
ncbi:ABC transporter permease [Microbacteriaceae bacterium K1510]|nr:ABC transporter permease [Microbacteriaceae bacterium K1510]